VKKGPSTTLPNLNGLFISAIAIFFVATFFANVRFYSETTYTDYAFESGTGSNQAFTESEKRKIAGELKKKELMVKKAIKKHKISNAFTLYGSAHIRFLSDILGKHFASSSKIKFSPDDFSPLILADRVLPLILDDQLQGIQKILFQFFNCFPLGYGFGYFLYLSHVITIVTFFDYSCIIKFFHQPNMEYIMAG
jgi:hypothetical protein